METESLFSMTKPRFCKNSLGLLLTYAYDGAKKMLLVDDVDNREFLCELVQSMWEELPEKKRKK